jgi:hypothetical protein
MPFLHTNAVRHWAVFMTVLLVLGITDLVFQPEMREPAIITFAVAAWLMIFAAGLVLIGLVQGTRSVRLHRSH